MHAHAAHRTAPTLAQRSLVRVRRSLVRVQRSLVGLTLACAALLSGCIVNADNDRGTLEVQWRPGDGNSCASLGINSVRVSIRRNQVLVDEIGGLVCEKGALAVTVEEGTYTAQVEGVASSGAIVAQTQVQTATVFGGQIQPTGFLPLQPVGGQITSAVAVAWTVEGNAALAGCLKFGVQNVSVSVLDEAKSKIIATVTVACNAGQATVHGVTSGARWLQLDGINGQGQVAYGNSPLFGPFQVQPDTRHPIAKTIDLVKLSAATGGISVAWSVQGQAAVAGCAKHGLQMVTVSVLDETKTKILTSKSVACSQGQAQVDAVPVGSRWLQIDASTGSKVTFGNAKLFGPVQIEGDKLHAIADTIDLTPL